MKKDLKKTAELARELWGILISKNAWISNGGLLAVFMAKDIYEASDEEREQAQNEVDELPLHQQMLMVAYHSCKDMELVNYKGGYAETNAVPLKKFYSCLALYGFSFSENEYTQLMDGSHQIYAVEEAPKGEANNDAQEEPDEETEPLGA